MTTIPNPLDVAREALERIASEHKEASISGYGHIWSPNCDACHPQKIAREALAAIQPLSSPRPSVADDGWLPIESAPKDGTEVLVWWPLVMLDDEGNVTGELATDNDRGIRVVSAFCGGMWNEPDELNARGDYFGDDREFAEVPTHWMPLPEPPT